MKIDVEGFEDLVLKGALETLQQHKPTLFLELHPQELASRNVEVSEILMFLSELNFVCEELWSSQGEALRPGHLFKFTYKNPSQ